MPLFSPPATGNAIRAFGYGAEAASLPATEPVPTFFPPAQPPIIAKPVPSLHGNALQPIDSACVFSTCANLQVSEVSSSHASRAHRTAHHTTPVPADCGP